jgi:hypothetical protein
MNGDIEEEFRKWRQARQRMDCPDKDAEHCAFMCGFELGLGNENWVERLLPGDGDEQSRVTGDVRDGLC